MKKILFLVLFNLCSLFYAPCSKAQGNLQFNQVISLSGSFTGSPTSKIDLGTVPAGKVWKLEYYTAGGSFTAAIFVNNTVFVENKLMWFKANDLLSMKGNCTTCGTCGSCASYTYFVSIVEFNIVP